MNYIALSCDMPHAVLACDMYVRCYVAVLAGLLDDSTLCDICVRITSLSRTCKVLMGEEGRRVKEGGREGRIKGEREGGGKWREGGGKEVRVNIIIF